jgi:hypothetical protein
MSCPKVQDVLMEGGWKNSVSMDRHARKEGRRDLVRLLVRECESFIDGNTLC